MQTLQKLPACIPNYEPLDPAGDAIWIPIPHASSEIMEMSYEVETALTAWGVAPARNESGAPITHPDDAAVGKYSLPEGWTVYGHRRGIEWSILDQHNHERIRIRYEPGEFDYIVGSWLSIPFDIQTRISKGTIPPTDWWKEVCYFEKVVFKSASVHPNTPDVVQARKETSDNIFFTQIFLPKLNELLAPQQAAAKVFMTESFPLFPADPTAYW